MASVERAIVVREFGGPEVMKVEERPALKPSEGEVLVDIKAVGVNPVETYVRAGQYAKLPDLPFTPGTDAAGVVKSVGSGVSKFKPGDRVYVFGSHTGTYATSALVSPDRTYKLPDNVTFEQGAALSIPYATAYRALFQKANIRPGQKVLIHGASGGVGIAAVHFARAHGVTVIGTAGSQHGLDLALKEGAHHVVNHKEPGYTKKILEFCPGGVDVIVEMLANVNLQTDLTMLQPDGCVVLLGSRGTNEINPRDAMMREATIYGVTLWRASEAALTEAHAAIYAGLENGSLRPQVGKIYSLNEAPEAHKQVIAQTGGAAGKIIIKID